MNDNITVKDEIVDMLLVDGVVGRAVVVVIGELEIDTVEEELAVEDVCVEEIVVEVLAVVVEVLVVVVVLVEVGVVVVVGAGIDETSPGKYFIGAG